MTTDTKLLPLPTGYSADEWGGRDTGPCLHMDEQVQDYARANVAHATAPLQAEIEALRNLCGMAYQLAGVHDAPEKWLDALSNAAAGRPFSTDGLLPYMPQAVCDAEAEAKALRAEVREAREFRDKMANAIGNDQLRRFIEKHGEPVPLTILMQEAEARAERLAEALRMIAALKERESDELGDAVGIARDALDVGRERVTELPQVPAAR